LKNRAVLSTERSCLVGWYLRLHRKCNRRTVHATCWRRFHAHLLLPRGLLLRLLHHLCQLLVEGVCHQQGLGRGATMAMGVTDTCPLLHILACSWGCAKGLCHAGNRAGVHTLTACPCSGVPKVLGRALPGCGLVRGWWLQPLVQPWWCSSKRQLLCFFYHWHGQKTIQVEVCVWPLGHGGNHIACLHQVQRLCSSTHC
jgi:hypothetical protein